MVKTRMYEGVKTWNPFKGCLFDCVYCRPSFQQQAKRQKRNCTDCYNYLPHEHPERLNKIPNAETVFVCGNSDISFAEKSFTESIIKAVCTHSKKHPEATYYFQSKRPAYFRPFVDRLPDSAIVLTTLETNRDEGYSRVSRALLPSIRYGQFLGLPYRRKAVTIEPVMDFDLEPFLGWIVDLDPEYVWLGFNSRPKQVSLPEPSYEKVLQLIEALAARNIEIKAKDLRGLLDPAR